MNPELQNNPDIIKSRVDEATAAIFFMRKALEPMVANNTLVSHEEFAPITEEQPSMNPLINRAETAERLDGYRRQADARNAVNSAHADFPLPMNREDFDRAA
jgi:hypothetical protein